MSLRSSALNFDKASVMFRNSSAFVAEPLGSASALVRQPSQQIKTGLPVEREFDRHAHRTQPTSREYDAILLGSGRRLIFGREALCRVLL